MKTSVIPRFAIVASLAALLLAGCAKQRSISNSAYTGPEGDRSWQPGSAFDYRGELNEFDVLAVDRDKPVSDDEIWRALDRAKTVRLEPGSGILLVQSGAVFPDGPMHEELKKHFQVTPFSGVPPRRAAETDPVFSYSKSLRLAAARAGCGTIVCYWGTLESARRSMETKTVSWVPFAGWVVPDESQQMRIRLKVALVDVRTGQWRMLSPEPFEDKAWSTRFSRGSSDQKQVELLKRKAYAACVSALMENAEIGAR